MKKIMMLLLAVSMVIALSACGSKDNAANNAEPAVDAGNAQQVNFTATNFKFDQAEYHVKKGEPVTFTLDSKEGVHGAEIKDLDVNLGPEKKTQTVTPDKAGTYEIHCSVPCGSGHTNMKAQLIVE